MSHTFQGETNTYNYNPDLSAVKVAVPAQFVHLQKTFKRTELDPEHEQDESDYYEVELDPGDLKDFFAEYLKQEMIGTIERRSGEEFLRWLTLMGD